MTLPAWSKVFVCFAIALLGACGGVNDSATPSSPSETVGDSDDQPVDDHRVASVEAELSGPHRSPESRARDGARHPAQTLEFFGLQPTMTVVEMAPGQGWYTEILAPYLRDQGSLTAAIPDPASSEYGERFLAFTQSHPDVYDRINTVIFSPPDQMSLGADGSADLVLTFRSVHGWINRGQAEGVFAAIARVLKPGGILGLVQHRAPEESDVTVTSPKGYVPESTVIELAEAAGLELEERSEINANPSDDHDHPEGVWTLPPTLRLGEQDRAQYEAIGESDRMTLRFRKPAA